MGQITSGIGLVSGLPIADIVDQLMAFQARPKQLIEKRNEKLTGQQEALQDLRTKLLAVKDISSKLILPTAFTQTTGASSDESVVTIDSRAGAVPGNYSFTVHRLVSAQQTITRGFADRGLTPVAPDGGATLTFDRGEARLESETRLADLNGGEGVRRGMIRISDASGGSAVVDLSAVATVDDVVKAINTAGGVRVLAEVDGDRLKLTDLSGGTGSLAVGDVGTTTTATSLGLVGSSATGELVGTNINTVGGQTLLARLNDSTGVRSDGTAAADLRISAGGTDYDIDLDGALTLGDVVERIEAGTAGAVTGGFTADGLGLELTGPAGFTVASLDSTGVVSTTGGAAEDLGIAGTAAGTTLASAHRLLAGINSKLIRNLNGGQGADLGTISITNRAGATTQVDLSGATSVSDLLDAINGSGAGVSATLNHAGNGLLLTDTSGGAGDLTIADVSGTGAVDLHLAGVHTGDGADSGNLQLKYLTGSTGLAQLGVAAGKMRITDSSGAFAVIQVNNENGTLGDVIHALNNAGLQLNARINDHGDGIVLEDTGPGVVAIQVEDDGSTTAKDLGLLGEAALGENLVGSFERTIQITSTDTLQDVAQKITDADIGVDASVINDGSAAAPFRLSISSDTSGTGGAFTFDDGGLGLEAATLSKAQDAVVFYGSSDAARAIVITSQSNAISQLIPGATINLKATSDRPVQVTISRDNAAIVEDMQGFVDAFNEVATTIDKVDSYDIETQERGVLLGDPAVAITRRQLYSTITGRNTDLTGQYNSLSQLGITVGREGQLEFDSAKFTTALETAPEAVEALFQFKQTEEQADGEVEVVASGIGVQINEMLDRLTRLGGGTVQSRIKTIESQVAHNESRIEDMDELLEQKRARLERKFANMEAVLSKMKGQSGALSQLQALANAARSQG